MINLLSKHLKLILVWGVLVGALSGGISLLFPHYYSADSQVLVISRDRNGVDPYTQAKSAERIGESLAEVMKSSDFYDKVFAVPNATFDQSRWSNLKERDRRKQWEKDVRAQMVYNTSILQLTVYSPTPADTTGTGPGDFHYPQRNFSTLEVDSLL